MKTRRIRIRNQRANASPAVAVAVILGTVLGVACGFALISATESESSADGAKRFCDVLKRIDSQLRERMAGHTAGTTSSPRAAGATRDVPTIH